MPKKPQEDKPVTRKFRINAGVHYEQGKRHAPKDNPIIVTTSDLNKFNNAVGLKRFEEIGDVVETEESATATQDGFDNMTVDELRRYAAEGEIDLTGLTRKEEIIEKLRASEVE